MFSHTELIFYAFVASIATLALMPLCIRIAARIGAIDQPDLEGRRVHTQATPRIGGMAIAVVYPVVCCMACPTDVLWDHAGLYAAILVLLIVGLLDDVRGVRPIVKLLGQILAACLAVALSPFALNFIPIPLSEWMLPLGIFAIPVSVFFVVGVINAINLIDGLDALATGVSLIVLAGLTVLAYAAGAQGMVQACLPLLGSLAAFLAYNSHPARIFLGDTGSMILGLCLGLFSLELMTLPVQELSESLGQWPYVYSPWLPFMLLIIPIADSIWVMMSRMLNGRHPFSADKTHVHHQILDTGVTHGVAVLVIHGSSLLVLTLALGLRSKGHDVLFLTTVCLVQGIIGGVRLLKRMHLYRRVSIQHRRWLLKHERRRARSLRKRKPLTNSGRHRVQRRSLWYCRLSCYSLYVLVIALLFVLASTGASSTEVTLIPVVGILLLLAINFGVHRDVHHHFSLFLSILGILSMLVHAVPAFHTSMADWKTAYLLLIFAVVFMSIFDLKLNRRFKTVLNAPLELMVLGFAVLTYLIDDDIIRMYHVHHILLASAGVYLALKTSIGHERSLPKQTMVLAVSVSLATYVVLGLC